MKNLLTAIATGGVLGGLNLNPTGLPTVNAGAEGFMRQLGTNLTAGVAKVVISSAINQTSLEEGLKTGLLNAFLDTVAAQGAFAIGEGLEAGELNSFTQKLAHIMAGCAVGAARPDGSCGAGALGAGIGELSAELYGERLDTVQFASMISGISMALAGGDARDINQASQAGANAAANNALGVHAGVNKRIAQESARLYAQCGLNCTQADFDRIDKQVASFAVAANLVEIAKRGTLTTGQAQQLAQVFLESAPGSGTAESVMQLITGKSSLTGEEADRVWAAIGVVPFGGVLKKAGEPVVDALLTVLKRSDAGAPQAAKGLLKGVENVASFSGLNEARASARQLSGLGDNAVNFVQEIGPLKGQVTGQMSPDGLRGWRVDFDSNKGFHVNWWDRSASPKRAEWLYGANKIEGGTIDQFWQTLEHFPKN